jgi:hypothetical protein
MSNNEDILGHVYVIEDELGRVKVGHTTRPSARMQAIETAIGLSIARSYVTPKFKAYTEAESRSHKLLDKYRGRGEWFTCDFDLAVVVAQAYYQKLKHI